MITVVHLITSLQPGGAENQLKQLILGSNAADLRHVVISLTDARGAIASELKNAGVQVHELTITKSPIGWTGMHRLVSLLKLINPDVLHCWMYHACLAGTLAARFTSVPRLIWGLRAAHGQLSDYRLTTSIVIRISALLSNKPELIVVNSNTSRDVHKQLRYPVEKIRVIPNGVDTNRFAPDALARETVMSELGIPCDCSLIGMLARYDPMKDHANFLRAAALVHDRYPRSHFVFAGLGTGEENQELKEMIRLNGLEKATSLLGERRDVTRLTAALDIACLSSWTESFPNVVAEAMACAVPCVVTDTGDCRDIVGDTGKVVPSRNPNLFAEAISEMLSLSPMERAALGMQARQRVLRKFSISTVVLEYLSIYSGQSELRVQPEVEASPSTC